MVEIIPATVKKIWDAWNIRGILLFSLTLQILLILVAPYRKATGKGFILVLVWCSYLLADWSASFGVGLIAAFQGDECKKTTPENADLLAFWAPFLLLHLGGPDVISALALEDNELWLRHLLNLVTQTVAALYVFAQSLPRNELWIPTMLMFMVGVFKYAERTRALHLASMDKFRDSMLGKAGPYSIDADWIKGCFARTTKPVSMLATSEKDETDGREKIYHLSDIQLVQNAHQFFNNFKVLFVDLFLNSDQRNQSRKFFLCLGPKTALRLIEIELNFMYDVLYTKVPVIRSKTGYIFRTLTFGAVLASLGVFHSKATKSVFNGFDVKVTYSLLICAVALDFIALFKLIFSDWSLVNLLPHEEESSSAKRQGSFWLGEKMMKHKLVSILIFFFKFKRPWWRRSPCMEEDGHKRHHVMATPIMFRRWSGRVSRHNLIAFCLKSYHLGKIHDFSDLNEEQRWSTWMAEKSVSIVSIIWYFTKYYVVGFILELENNILVDRLTLELWVFIFQEMKRKSNSAADLQAAKKISTARGSGIQTDDANLEIPNWDELMQFVTDVKYDESLLIWHIATQICYNEDKEKMKYNSDVASPVSNSRGSQQNDDVEDTATIPNFKSYDYREFSKMLSDYMFYLLIMQPTVIPASMGIGKVRLEDTCADVKANLRGFGKIPEHHKDIEAACDRIFYKRPKLQAMAVKETESKSVWGNACILANMLIALDEVENPRVDKWEVMSKIWVELMAYSAVHCKADTHAQLLRRGGELITFVWLLMAHFGLGDAIYDEE